MSSPLMSAEQFMTRGDGPQYLPILKSRQGELKALAELTAPVGGDLTPVIELVEVDFENVSVPERKQALDKLVTKIARAWAPPRPRLIVDCSGVEVDTEAHSWGTHEDRDFVDPVTPEILGGLHQQGVRAVPVVRLSDLGQPRLVESLTQHLKASSESGACLRVGAEDLDDTVVPMETAVFDLLERFELTPETVDLILDFGAVGDDAAVTMAARLAQFVLPALDRADWRSFALGAGGFPADLSEVSAFSLAELPRRDRAMWMKLSSMRMRNRLDYSDYAVTHPRLQTGVAFAAPPQIRYAAGPVWLVMKGRRTDRRGHRQFFDLCGRIRSDRPLDMMPRNQSWGDKRFHDAAEKAGTEAEGPGNASTWRAIATSHHIAYVLSGLRSVGVP